MARTAVTTFQCRRCSGLVKPGDMIVFLPAYSGWVHINCEKGGAGQRVRITNFPPDLHSAAE